MNRAKRTGGMIVLTALLALTHLAVASLLLASPTFAAPEAAGVRVGDHADKTRFVIDLTEKVDFSLFTLPNPYRVVIDLPEIAWHAPASGRPKADGLIQNYRFGLFADGHSRLVLDLGGPAKVQSAFVLPPSSDGPWRFVLDLAPTTASSFADKGEGVGGGFVAPKPTEASPAPPQQEASIAPPPPKPAKPNAQPKEAARMPVVVIDAGHGGVDPGATGVSGIYEKHITLAMARQLRDSLVATGRYRVVLTRDRDVFIPLRKRVEIARAAGGDLFLSIHSDSIDNPKTRGLSVYTLSENASDVEAGLLAERENKVDLIAGMDLSSESREVTDILIDLAQRETMNLSARYASFAVGELRREAKLLGRTHRFASFAVLKAPDIPSVLLEIGYLSHKDEERQLREKDYRAKLARSITKSVDQFFAQAQKALLP